MKQIRTTSILAGLLLLAAAASTTACDKKDDGKNKTKNTTVKTNKVDNKNKGTTTSKTVAKNKTPASAAKTKTGDGYVIKIERPVPIGFKYRLVSSGKRDVKLTMNGRVMPGRSGVTTWDYEAEVTVKAISKNGKPTAEDHKVIKFEVTKNGAKSTTVAKDTVIVATVKATAKGNEESFAIDGKPVDKKIAGFLEPIISLDEGKGTNDDALFGATGLKKPGDSWDVNKENMAKDFGAEFKDSPMPIRAKNITGKVTLVAAKTIDGVAALSFKISLNIKDVAPNMGPVKPTAGTISITMDGWLPADPKSVQGQGGKRKTVMHVEGEMGQGGQVIKFVMDMTQETSEKKLQIK